jgi:hypothetical protein
MKAKSVRQLLESAAHVECWKPNVGWVAIGLHSFYDRFTPSNGDKPFYRYQAIDFNSHYRIVTVKGKAIA